MHPNSRLLFERHARGLFRAGMRVLEVGPDARPSSYQQVVGDPAVRWESIDLDIGVAGKDALTHVAKGEYEFGLEDDAFDVVVSGQVIEHVRKPWVWIRELARVCKPGGKVITVNPVSWPYHEAPVDCWRIYPEGMKALYDEAGLTVELSRCETLEVRPRFWRVPGKSYHRGPMSRLRRLVTPATYALDTVTIGTKPPRPGG